MEPATYCLTLDPGAAAFVPRLQDVLAAQGAPAITMKRLDDLIIFRCATGDFMLRARVADALMTVCGHDRWQRLFRPLP